jgi:hypothetical protein
MPHLFLATPCYGGLLTHGYFHSVINLLLHSREAGIGLTIETLARDSLIPRARNALVAKFMAHPAATHMLFADADIGFAPDDVAGLLALGEDVAACMYPLKQMEWDAAAVARARAGELISTASIRYVGKPMAVGRQQWRGGFVTAEYAGTGLMLVSRRAIARLIAANPALHYTADHATPDMPADHLYALFDTGIDPATRHYLSEDYMFCARWRALGGDIWLNTRSRLTHAGTYDFIGDPAFRFPAPPDEPIPGSGR